MNIREHSNQAFTRQGGREGGGTRNNPLSSVFNNKLHCFPSRCTKLSMKSAQKPVLHRKEFALLGREHEVWVWDLDPGAWLLILAQFASTCRTWDCG